MQPLLSDAQSELMTAQHLAATFAESAVRDHREASFPFENFDDLELQAVERRGRSTL